MIENIWRDFANINGMTTDEFSKELILTVQAVLAMQLNKKGCDMVRITSNQLGDDYELIFRKITSEYV